MNYKNKNIAILGHGLEGLDAYTFLTNKGANVTILDQKDDINYLSNLDKYDIIVRSPGVYPYKQELVKAKKLGVRITTPTHIFMDEFSGVVIGVTGTKGKGTTSTLIYEILKEAKLDVYLAGNIGKPMLDLLHKLNKNSYVILEMSSFQLIDLPVSPNISVVLNITSDHMDWHKNKKEYLDAKKNIVKFQTKTDWSVINSEYKSSREFSKITNANVILFSKKTLSTDLKHNLILRGKHNLENISAAVSVAKILNISKDVISHVVHNFKGLEHRLEFVREINNIKFYNDSFATGPQPTIAAIKSFKEDKTLILGGSDKGLNYKTLGQAINNSSNIKNIILIGTTASKIEKEINHQLPINIINLGFAKMKEIVKKAYQVSKKGSVVVLSPASASFDMFKDYKDRGNQFKDEVNKL